uniref:Uncharacterized protein n=1 Tax=Oryza sativa subsp. japonica TaxID=39947 RepID=Q7XEF9_ORYSJ|nr:hypothetical protein LOC_Os10g28830 [Oryza sativa Japonica Group]
MRLYAKLVANYPRSGVARGCQANPGTPGGFATGSADGEVAGTSRKTDFDRKLQCDEGKGPPLYWNGAGELIKYSGICAGKIDPVTAWGARV